jgi:hypothetical protein
MKRLSLDRHHAFLDSKSATDNRQPEGMLLLDGQKWSSQSDPLFDIDLSRVVESREAIPMGEDGHLDSREFDIVLPT